ncbi:M48 family metallopeptidase [Parendozoicomonas haliclonae]|uniref:TPR repeat-containing protein YfgC n=1 Tax=Parendozoicomonas haliclonae TaxID=1960125 RepID=A0A1X7APC5_9GAMM|nr:M48 family metallopeptidase [Parendozoicomonas haliclonae]SMA49972.1 TPR repeat-containing protein YfgC precursor [Parendozoicomonas haliclonae]
MSKVMNSTAVIRKLKNLVPVLFLTLLAGCQTVHTTSGGSVGIDREQRMFSLLSSEQVDQMSSQSYQEMRSQAKKERKLVSHGQQVRRLQTIADRLTRQVGVFRPDAGNWPWQVTLIQEDTLNASCLPGGRIVFYSGIIETLKLNDDEIAAIMGHEIAHALREHGREAMSEAYMVQLGSSLTGALLGVSNETLDMANQVVHYAMTLPNSRTNEAEADIIGLELMARAGYNPEAAVSLWKKMAAQNTQRPPEFMSTHPATETRIDGLNSYIPKVRPLYQQAVVKTG